MDMKKLLYLSLIIGAFCFASSCQREGVLYDMPANCALVSFPAEDAVYEMVASDGNKITLLLNRGNTKGSVSIPVSVVEDKTDGVFKLTKSTFDFADGEAVASIDITYPDINKFGGEVYEMTIAVDDEDQVSPSGFGEVTVSAQRKLTWKFLGTGVWYTDFFEEEWEQPIYTTEEAPNYYIFPDCWVEGVNFTFTVVDGKPVFPDVIPTGYSDPTYGPVSMYVSNAVAAGAPEPYYDPDENVIVLYVQYRVAAGSFGISYEAFELPEGVKIF